MGGEGYRSPYDGNGVVFDGAAKGLTVGDGVNFFVDGRIYEGKDQDRRSPCGSCPQLPYRDGIDVELPLEVLTHLSFASG